MTQSPTVGVLLVNIGSPASTEIADVRRYLRVFLSDPRVIDMPTPLRWLLLNLIILPFRPKRSARAYARIWTDEGSPLIVHSLALAARLQARLGAGAKVLAAMCYSEPSIAQGLDALAEAGVDRILVVPMYPQYAGASTGAAFAQVSQLAAERWVVPNLQFVGPFWQHPAFLDAVTALSRGPLAQADADHVLMSFHGVPVSHCTRTDPSGNRCRADSSCCETLDPGNRDCYRAQCYATARALTERLGLNPESVTVSFQSRLGRTPWIEPYTDKVLVALPRQGVRKLAVLEPSFVADCLETLEELGITGAEAFMEAGGEALTLIPCLNAEAVWAQALSQILTEQCPALGGRGAS